MRLDDRKSVVFSLALLFICMLVVPVASSPLNIGTMAYDAWFPGTIAKVAIYNYLLTPSQITNHYKTMTGNQPTGSCHLHLLTVWENYAQSAW